MCAGRLTVILMVGVAVTTAQTPQPSFDMASVKWTSGTVGTPVGPTPSPDDGPSIFSALQEQLGLRLEPGRGTFDVVAVDAIHRPTPD